MTSEQGAIETGRGVAHPWLCDVMGHFSTRHYYALFDDASYHLFAALGLVIEEGEGRRIGWADVRHEIDFRHEIAAGELLVLRSGVVRVGRSSVTYRTWMSRLSDGLTCSVLQATTVRFDLVARRAVEVDVAIRTAAQRLQVQPED